MEQEDADQSWHTISSSLLFRVRERQADAWQRLAHLVGPLIYEWTRRTGLQPDDAADVSQQVLQAVYQNIDRFRRDKEGDSFTGWLWTITRNKTRDYFRNLQQEPVADGGTEAHWKFQQLADDPPDEDHGGESSISAQLTHRALQLVQSEFETRTWDAFWRATVQRERPAEIAEDLNMTLHAVYKAKSRVLRRVRQELEGIVSQATI